MDFTRFMNKFNEIERQLSPTSALRLSFDNISPETEEPESKRLFGVPVPPFVSDKVVTWLEEEFTDPPIFYGDTLVLKKVENVRMIDRYNTKNPIVGTLYLTATHLIFVEPDTNKETWILHMHIASIEKLPLTTTGSPLLIRCKTFLSVTFVIPKDSECHDVYMSLVKLYQPVSINKLYCFNYQPVKDDLPKSAGWDFFKLENEFKRMRVPNDIWTLCSLNANYELCDTYPRQIYVPQEANTAMLIGSSRFRSKGRLPALTYLHSNKSTWSLSNRWLSKKIEPYPDISIAVKGKSPEISLSSFNQPGCNINPYLMCTNEKWQETLCNSKAESSKINSKRLQEIKLNPRKTMCEILAEFEKLQSKRRRDDDMRYRSKYNDQNVWAQQQQSIIANRSIYWDFVHSTSNPIKSMDSKPECVKKEKNIKIASEYDSQRMYDLLKPCVDWTPFMLKRKQRRIHHKIPVPCCPKTIKYIACRKCTKPSNLNSKKKICPRPSFSEYSRYVPLKRKELPRRKVEDMNPCDTTKHIAIKNRFKLPPDYTLGYFWDISKFKALGAHKI
uniref:Myotubularin phosphatase domain-containing protein n=1 Tax=Glossina brevipalpis TaxID=37001 RepID=A0A1A9W9M5_9MUSC